jgi:hypothetical protein
MEPMSRNRQIVTTIVVLVVIIGGLVLALFQMGVLKECLALLNCG